MTAKLPTFNKELAAFLFYDGISRLKRGNETASLLLAIMGNVYLKHITLTSGGSIISRKLILVFGGTKEGKIRKAESGTE